VLAGGACKAVYTGSIPVGASTGFAAMLGGLEHTFGYAERDAGHLRLEFIGRERRTRLHYSGSGSPGGCPSGRLLK
jgi:hypothetical protein